VLAPNGFAGAFADADQSIEGVLLRRLAAAKVLVDEAPDQRGKAHSTQTRLLPEPAVLLRFQ
jgi:cellobiose-specific phosphotransferase system component IIA